MRVTIYPSTLSKIIDFAAIDLKKESAGFLIGKIVGEELLITDSTMTKHTSNAVHVIVDNTEMAEIADELSTSGENENIIGWWHSHPGMGARFMSGTDTATQEQYQKLFPHAVALVIDPVKFLQTGKIEDLDYKCYTLINKNYKPLETKIADNQNEILVTTFKSIKSLRKDLQRLTKKTYEEKTQKIQEKTKKNTEAHIIILTLWTIALTITTTLILLSL
ncbi:MAG: Mov34/MPN/PAD-1 family protein [Candidatus Jordarchaeaceae archaeon]